MTHIMICDYCKGTIPGAKPDYSLKIEDWRRLIPAADQLDYPHICSPGCLFNILKKLAKHYEAKS